jgi:hypothetical protein
MVDNDHGNAKSTGIVNKIGNFCSYVANFYKYKVKAQKRSHLMCGQCLKTTILEIWKLTMKTP